MSRYRTRGPMNRSRRGLLHMVCFTLLVLLGSATASAASELTDATIVLRGLAIDHSDLLSDDELGDITGRYVGREIAVEQLYDMVAAIDALYERKGYLARAILPEQTIEDGIVDVRLVEGRIGIVVIEGNRHTKAHFISDRLGVASGDLVGLDVIELGLLNFNDTYDAALHAELAPGEAFGTTDVIVHVLEPVNNDYSLSTDNGGRDEIGLSRHSFTWENRSLFGRRDPLTLSMTSGEGSQAGSLAYTMPVGGTGTRLGVSYSYNIVDIIDGDFGDVNIQGDSSNVRLFVDVPFRTRKRDKLGMQIAGSMTDSGTYFDGHKLAGFRLTTWTLTGRGNFVRAPNHWGFAYIFTTGQDDIQAHTFSKHTLAGSFQRLFANGSVFAFNVTGQLTDSVLLPNSEQFMLGGMATVRGYAAGKLTGDEGYLVNIEWGAPLLSWLDGALYVDHGGVVPYKGNEEPLGPDDYVTSAAVGFDVHMTKHMSARLLWGKPIDGSGTNGGGEGTFFFRLQANF